MSDFYEEDYLSVKDRKKRSQKRIKKLQEEGEDINPVATKSRIKIAHSFWGMAWCRNLESYRDLDYRLDQGRSYLRQDAVVDLQVLKRKVKAQVSGSLLYQVEIKFEKLSESSWNSFVEKCCGEINSILDLLSGKIPDELSKLITDKECGLFPKSCEIKFSCNCLDYADVCKHVAATLYGIGVVFDKDPSLFFLLRDVDPEYLMVQISKDFKKESPDSTSQKNIENIFDIDIVGSDF